MIFFLAEITTGGLLIALAVAGALSVAAGLLLRPKIKTPSSSDAVTTLTQRGSPIPILIGRRLVGPVFAWRGDRKVNTHDSGGKGFMGGPGGGNQTFAESGWHILCVGPINKLHAIYENGEVIWEGPINSYDTPSGSRILLSEGEGQFLIYWGDVDQPINEFLAASNRVGIRSQWPCMAYILWNRKALHSSPAWGQIEYDVESFANNDNLDDSNCYFAFEEATGANPAYVIFQIICAPHPWGAGLTGVVDKYSLEAFGVLMQNERMPVNMTIGNQKAAEPLQAILTDMGVFMPQVGDKLVFVPIRAATVTPPSFSDEVQSPPDFEKEMVRGDRVSTRIIFNFANEDLRYQTQDIKIEDDANSIQNGAPSPTEISISSVTNLFVASKVARRRTPEALGNVGRVKVQALHGARQLVAGMLFDLADFGRMRVSSAKLSDDSPEVILDCMVEFMGKSDTTDEQAAGGSSGTLLAPEPDLYFTFVQWSYDLVTVPTISVFRIRAHQEIIGATVWGSGDETAYTQLGNQDTAAAGGTLTETISATTDSIIAVGPIFTPLNDDIQDVLDLSDDEPSWQAGKQIALIGEEVFYVESFEAIDQDDWADATSYSTNDVVKPTIDGLQTGLCYICTGAGTSGADEPLWPQVVGETVVDSGVTWQAIRFKFRPLNMIRARAGTTAAAHSINDVIYIIDSAQLVKLTGSLIQVGNHLCVKTDPFTTAAAVDLTEVTAVCKDIVGDGPYRLTSDDEYRITKTGDRRVYIED